MPERLPVACLSWIFAVALPGAARARPEPRQASRPERAPATAPTTLRLELRAGGTAFMVPQRSTAAVPGSHGQVEVRIDDITRGRTRLSLRTTAGTVLVPPRAVAAGDAVFFQLGGEGYSIEVERLRNKLIGQDQAALRVTRGVASRAGAIDHVTGPALAGLVHAGHQLERAEAALEPEDLAAALAALRSAHERQEAVGLTLRAQPDHRLAIHSDGAVFHVEENASQAVPGSCGWLEVWMGDVSSERAHLGVRSFQGEELVPARALRAGDEVTFRFGGQEHAIRVERLQDFLDLVTGHDVASLRVTSRGGDPGTRGAPAATIPAAPVPQPVQVTLLELVRSRVADAQRDVLRAQVLLEEGRPHDARAALHAGRRRNAEALLALRQVDRAAAWDGPWAIGDLSVVKVRIAKVLPVDSLPDAPDVQTARERLAVRAVLGMGRAIAGALGEQRVEARILQAATVGKRHASRTRLGREHRSMLREDLPAAGMIELEISELTSGVGRLTEGQEYWLAITPPIAHKALPREAGTGDHVEVVFALPVTAKR